MLRPTPMGPVPDDTACVAHAAFPKGHPYLTLADELGTRFMDEPFAALAQLIGADGHALLDALEAPAAPGWLRELPAAAILRRVWLQNFSVQEDHLRWRTGTLGVPPAARFISSPYDPDAHLAKKRSTHRVGYTLQLTETCDDALPALITPVETSAGPVAGGAATPRVHEALAQRDFLPDGHIVDTGYLDAALLVSSRADVQVDLLGPTRADYHWQAREATGCAVEHVRIDGERQEATGPAGHTSSSGTPAVDKRTNEVITVKVSTTDCGPCPGRERCTRSTAQSPRRTITVRREAEYQALPGARERAGTQAFVKTSANRAGAEGTLSRAVRRTRLRRTRYVGEARVHPGHVVGAVALNFLRLGEWFTGAPRAQTRHTAFARLIAAAA